MSSRLCTARGREDSGLLRVRQMLVLPLGQQSHVLQATQDFNPASSMYVLFRREITTTRSKWVPTGTFAPSDSLHCPLQGAMHGLDRVTPIPWKGFCYILKGTSDPGQAAVQGSHLSPCPVNGAAPEKSPQTVPIDSPQLLQDRKPHAKHQHSQTQFTPTPLSAETSIPAQLGCSASPAP